MAETIEPAMTKARARQVTKAIQQAAGDLWDMLRVAHEGRAWEPLGYPSWDAYVRAEFDMSRRNANRLVAQAEVIAAIEAALPAQVGRARPTPPPVSARQAPQAKKKLPEIVNAVSRGVEPVEAVADAVGSKSREVTDDTQPNVAETPRAAGATASRGAQPPSPPAYPWDGKRADIALCAVVDELVRKLGVGPARSALRDQDARIRPNPRPVEIMVEDAVDCAHPKAQQVFNGTFRKCGVCLAVVR